MTDKDRRQAEYFQNRVIKNEKSLRRWARREAVGAFRLYDRDIPEVPLALDLYLDAEGISPPALVLALYDRPYEKSDAAEAEWLALMAGAAAEAIGSAPEYVFARTRRRMKGLDQYEKLGQGGAERVVREGASRFIVNLSDYLDTGLFLDHRPLRYRVREEAAQRRVLNLFSYTGSFSVHAASGGADEVTTVDLSNTYLDWAGRNLELNGFSGARYPLVRADVRDFLGEAARKGKTWDLIVADPPTFSNSKAASADFDVIKDWPSLLDSCFSLLAPGGVLYFSTNSRRLVLEPGSLAFPCEDISASTIPPDFRDQRIHRTWRIEARKA